MALGLDIRYKLGSHSDLARRALDGKIRNPSIVLIIFFLSFFPIIIKTMTCRVEKHSRLHDRFGATLPSNGWLGGIKRKFLLSWSFPYYEIHYFTVFGFFGLGELDEW